MNSIVRHFPFDRYSPANRPEDYIDLEGAKEQTDHISEVTKKADKKLYCNKLISHKNLKKLENDKTKEMGITL